jgi:hypothetical protein
MNVSKLTALAILASAVPSPVQSKITGKGVPQTPLEKTCHHIANSGSVAIAYLDGKTSGYRFTNPESFGSNNWHILNNTNHVLDSLLKHPAAAPFIKYEQNSNGEIVSASLIFNEEPVSEEILQRALALLTSAVHVQMPLSFTSVGSYASSFTGNDRLVSFSAPGLISVNNGLFQACTSLSKVRLPVVELIGNSAFEGCADLSIVELSDSLRTIGQYVFKGCTSLVNIKVPNSVTALSNEVFNDCENLRYLTIPSGITSFGGDALRGAPIETLTISWNAATDNIPTLLGNFYAALTDGSTMHRLNLLINPSIAGNITKNELNAVLGIAQEEGGENYEQLFYQIGNNSGGGFIDLSETTIGISDLNNLDVNEEIHWILSLPCTAVGSGLGILLPALSGVILPKAASITADAFSGCSSNITKLGLVDTVTIADTAFDTLEAVDTLEIIVTQPEKFTSFLSKLTAAGLNLGTLEKIVIKIHDSIVDDVQLEARIADLIKKLPAAQLPAICLMFFDLQNTSLTDFPLNKVNCDFSCVFAFPNESQTFVQSRVETSISSAKLSVLEEIGKVKTFVVSPNVTTLGPISANLLIDNLVLPEGLETIASDAFSDPPLLKKVTIPASVTHISPDAFSGSAVTTIDFKKDSLLTTIGEEAFISAAALQRITLPNTITAIGDYAFSGTTLYEIIFPESLETIGEYAFDLLPLVELEFPASVTAIGADAFNGVASIELVEFPPDSALQTIGNRAFSGCSGLKLVQLPPSIQYVGTNAFDGATSIQEFGIPTKDFSIATNAIPAGASIQVVSIICTNTTAGNVVDALAKLKTAGNTFSAAEKLIVSLDPALVASLSKADLLAFATSILHLASGDIIDTIKAASGVFELDVSNTDFVPTDFPFDSNQEVLPWAIFFKKDKQQ